MTKDRLKDWLVRTHPYWSSLIPGGHRPYRFAGGEIYLNVRESPMMLARALGRYEVAKHAALEAYLRPGATFVDVGANKGDFSLLAARLVGAEGRVLAFEPEPTNCRWIAKSVARNGYRNVELHPIALSDENGRAALHLGEKSGWHTLVPGLPQRDRGSVTVETRRLDDFLVQLRFPRPIDVIKIDVEGADMQVLRGARGVLSDNPAIVVLLDVHPRLGVRPDEVAAYLEGLGFSLYDDRPPFTDGVTDLASLTSLVARRPAP